MVRTPETARTLDQVCSGTKDKPEVVKGSESGQRRGQQLHSATQEGPWLLDPRVPYSESAWVGLCFCPPR